MLASKYADRKSTPCGKPIATASEADIRKCRGMMYWLRWKDHTFDIRVMWKLLGIENQPYFIEKDKPIDDWKENPDFYTDFLASIEGKDFADLMRLHDEAMASCE